MTGVDFHNEVPGDHELHVMCDRTITRLGRANEELTEQVRLMRETGGPTWTTTEMQRDFVVKGFALGHVVVIRRCDGCLGSLAFTHAPRVYHSFVPHEEGR